MVNVQVTAMTSFLECASNIGYVILVTFTVRTSYTTLLEIMTLYMIMTMTTTYQEKKQ